MNEEERLRGIAKEAIRIDKTGLIKTINKMITFTKGYEWIPDDEWGPYDYTQRNIKTLQKEVGYLIKELEKVGKDGIKQSDEFAREYERNFDL